MANKKNYRIVLIGPQGSGKGTQARLLTRRREFLHIVPGRIFRDLVRRKTKLGLEIKRNLDKGKLIPNRITNRLIKESVEKAGKKSFVLDGYPRNNEQLKAVMRFANPTHVFFISISRKLSIKRISGRRVCQCGEMFNIYFNAPEKKGVCDKCGSKLERRRDDYPEAVKKRLEIYHQQTEPLLDFFKKIGILHEVNGEDEVDKVYKSIVKHLK